MNDDDKALVKQLRASECIAYYDDEPGMVADEELLDDAADRIEALSAENERLREAILQMKRIPNYIRKDDNRKEMLKIINAALGEAK